MNENGDGNNKSDEKRLDNREEVLTASSLSNLCDFSRYSLSPAVSISHPSEILTPVFKSPGGGGGGTMAATANAMGFSLFTPAQWKELERQAMIYKYMMASVPIPHELLFPISMATAIPNPSSASSSFNFPWGRVGGMVWVNNNVMGKDAEPWRCRRTDGKKWRCSRDVTPNQKYCERHLRRGRPRSRKPVESPSSSELISPLNHNNRHQQNHSRISVSGGGTGTNNNKTTTHLEENGDSNNPLGILSSKVVSFSGGSRLGVVGPSCTQPFEGQTGGKGWLSFEPTVVSSSREQQHTTRGMEWMMKDQASTVVHTSSQNWEEMKQFSNTAAFGTPQTLGDDYVSYKSHPHPTRSSDFVVQNKSQRTFIDAWSNSFSDKPDLESPTTTSNRNRNISSEMGVGEGDYIYTSGGDMYNVQTGFDLFNNSCESTSTTSDGERMKSLNCLSSSKPPESWALSSAPGGPLAEVLRPPIDLTPADLSSSDRVNESLFVSAAANMASSPSGVIQMKSDSSGTSNSPSSTCDNMKLTTPFQWLI